MNASALPPITLSSLDLRRLEALLDTPAQRGSAAARALEQELGRATVLPPENIPADVVTMNSAVACVDDFSGETHELTLVYPNDADATAGRVSVLAPVGNALLGLTLGQEIDWQAPGGRPLRVRVTAVRHPSETTGELPR